VCLYCQTCFVSVNIDVFTSLISCNARAFGGVPGCRPLQGTHFPSIMFSGLGSKILVSLYAHLQVSCCPGPCNSVGHELDQFGGHISFTSYLCVFYNGIVAELQVQHKIDFFFMFFNKAFRGAPLLRPI
jgi:hypothetical protein